jgi:Protein of unknown function (DUF3592)
MGVACLILTAIMGASTAHFIARSAGAAGTVIALDEKVNAKDHRTYYYPVFSFEAGDGRSYTVVSREGRASPAYSVGQVVRVRYDRANPNVAGIRSMEPYWAGSVIRALAGVLFLGVSRALKSAQKRDKPAVRHPGS